MFTTNLIKIISVSSHHDFQFHVYNAFQRSIVLKKEIRKIFEYEMSTFMGWDNDSVYVAVINQLLVNPSQYNKH